MPQDATAEAPVQKEISIHDQSFPVSTPYSEGHTLSAVEAKVLNQVRAENIANNFRKRIKNALEGVAAKEGEAPETLDAVRTAFAEYDAKYTFSMPSAGGGREPLDPVEREALRIARQAIKDALAASGRKLKDVDEEKLEAAIEQAAKQDDIVAEARKRVKKQKQQAESVLAGLDL